jgi:hypothetical protein
VLPGAFVGADAGGVDGDQQREEQGYSGGDAQDAEELGEAGAHAVGGGAGRLSGRDVRDGQQRPADLFGGGVAGRCDGEDVGRAGELEGAGRAGV